MVFERVRRAVADILNCDESLVLESSGIFDDLGASSLDAVELVVLLEKQYGVILRDADAARAIFKTLNTLADFILSQSGDHA